MFNDKRFFPTLLFSRRTSNGADGALQAEAVPRSVPVHIAYELLQAGHHYLDVRYVLYGCLLFPSLFTTTLQAL